jgi:hypothetical protein
VRTVARPGVTGKHRDARGCDSLFGQQSAGDAAVLTRNGGETRPEEPWVRFGDRVRRIDYREIHGRDRLRGLLREYYRAAAVRRDKNNGALRRSGGNQDPSAHRRVAPGASRLRDLDFRLTQRSRYLPVEDVVDRILQAQLLALPPGLWCDFA